jgi:hypothetical protein
MSIPFAPPIQPLELGIVGDSLHGHIAVMQEGRLNEVFHEVTLRGGGREEGEMERGNGGRAGISSFRSGVKGGKEDIGTGAGRVKGGERGGTYLGARDLAKLRLDDLELTVLNLLRSVPVLTKKLKSERLAMRAKKEPPKRAIVLTPLRKSSSNLGS